MVTISNINIGSTPKLLAGGKVTLQLEYKMSDNATIKSTTDINYETLKGLLTDQKLAIFYNDIDHTGESSVHNKLTVDAIKNDSNGSNPSVLFEYTLDLVPGKTFAFHASLGDGGASSESPLVSAKAIDVPEKTLLTLTSLDAMVRVELGNSFNSSSDGYSPIKKLLVHVYGEFLDTDSGDSTGLQHRLITIDVSNNGTIYTASRTIENLLNNKSYEIVGTAFNEAGSAAVSDSYSISPSNTPDTLNNQRVKMYSKLKYDGVSANSDSGGVVVFANWPNDKTNLEQSGLRINSVKVVIKFLKKSSASSWTEDASASDLEKVYHLVSDLSGDTYVYSNDDGVYSANGFTDLDNTSRDFKFIIGADDVPVGKAVKTYVVFGNQNGYPSDLGSPAGQVMSMLLPEKPVLKFHVIAGDQSATTDASRCTFEIYRTDPAVVNGGDILDYRITGTKLALNGSASETVNFRNFTFTDFSYNQNNVTKYRIVRDASNAEGANLLSIGETYTLNVKTSKQAVLDESADTYESASTTLSLIAKNNISSVQQIRLLNWDPATLTPFKIDNEAAINFQFKAEPILQSNSNTFYGGINGSNMTQDDIYFLLAKNSQLLPEASFNPIAHPGNNYINSTLGFDIKQPIGTQSSYYIRMRVRDRFFTTIDTSSGLPTEPTTEFIISEDSSPALSTASEGYIPAVSSLVFNRHTSDATKGSLSFVRPTSNNIFNSSGFNPTDASGTDASFGLPLLTRRAHHSIVVIDDISGSVVNNAVFADISGGTLTTDIVPWNYTTTAYTTGNSNNVSLNIQNLIAGRSYTIAVLSGMYVSTKSFYQSDGGEPTEFVIQSIIRKSYVTTSFVAAALPASPTYRSFGKDEAVYVEWNALTSSQLRGGTLDKYEIAGMYYYIDDSGNPTFPEGQQPVIGVENARYVTLQKVWADTHAGLNGTPETVADDTIDILNTDRNGNETIIATAIRTISTINSAILVTTTYTVSSNAYTMINPPTLSGTTQYTAVTIAPTQTELQSQTLTGNYGAVDYAAPGPEPDPITNLTAASSTGRVTISFDKNVSDLNDEVRITINEVENILTSKFKGEEGGTDTYQNVLDASWNAAYKASVSITGLLFIQSVLTDANSTYSTNHPEVYAKVTELFGGVVDNKFVFYLYGDDGVTMNIGVCYVDINALSNEEVLGPINTIVAAPSAPPDAAQNLSFNVDASGIVLNWNPPVSSGGAGIAVTAGRPANGALMYEITSYKNSTNNTAATSYSAKDITAQTYRIGIPISSTDQWYLSIQTYYYNEGDVTKPSLDNTKLKWFNVSNGGSNTTISSNYYGIIVGPKPNVGSLEVLDQSNNQIKMKYTLPTQITNFPYPINKLKIYNNDTLNSTIDASSSDATVNFDYGSAETFTISSLKNGSSNNIKVEPVRNYFYAQSPEPSTVNNIVPYSQLLVDSSSSSITNGARDLTTVIKMNGDPLKSVVIVGRDTSGSIVVSPVQTSYTVSGAEDNNTVANQTATINTSFTNPMDSFLAIAVGTNTSDIGVIPINATSSWGTYP